nr:type II CRISPR RNA-guided endonuclease Cas9 [Companilactobacillus furfuricola]
MARNLVDTRYASRVVLNSLTSFFNNQQFDTKVTVVRGKFTSNMRKHWKINKSRDSYYHHAIDASIIAATPFLKIWKKGATLFPKKVSENELDISVGEIISDKEYDAAIYKEPYAGFFKELKNQEQNVKFSYQVDKKMNRTISNATIYSTRKAKLSNDKEEADYVVSKINNIYDPREFARFKKIYDRDKSKILLSRFSPQSFKKLEDIMDKYPCVEEKVLDNGDVKEYPQSPFEFYRRGHGEVRKYSKKGNGPVIRQLKYLDEKLGEHIDITDDKTKNKKVILKSLKPWRTDVYFNHETQKYEIMGLKYSDLKFNTDEGYGIKLNRYLEIKSRESISNESEFLYSLYRRDRIKAYKQDTGEEVELIFWSKNETNPGYAEFKPLDKADVKDDYFPIYGGAKTRLIKKFAPDGTRILKVNTNVLGDTYYVRKESNNPKNILD